ncbi:MAG: RIP metalloprotease RseP [candidate division Zixibacteria bacterium]|nr:RIP metalloprotease RseP [candidate division Zixibacteria bacterium]
MLLTLLAFVFVLGMLVFFHELGHFVVAKWVGIRVEKFSLGFPPNIFARKRGDTEYCIGIIPLGGYVKMAGENPDESVSGDAAEFMSKSVLQRTGVILAGPFMNYVLAILISVGIFYFRGSPLLDTDRIIVDTVTEGAPAYEAGLATDDQIIAINDKPVKDFNSLTDVIYATVNEEIELTWIHQGDTISRKMVTQAQPSVDADGTVDTIGIIGFAPRVIGYENYSLFESITGGIETTHLMVVLTAKFVYQFITGKVSPKMMGGPLFIARQSGREAKRGLVFLFRFMALLSVNLAILNILPIPVLDGGHLVFLGIEKIKGSPLSMKARAMAQQVGMILLLGLIVFVTYNDIIRAVKGF